MKMAGLLFAVFDLAPLRSRLLSSGYVSYGFPPAAPAAGFWRPCLRAPPASELFAQHHADTDVARTYSQPATDGPPAGLLTANRL